MTNDRRAYEVIGAVEGHRGNLASVSQSGGGKERVAVAVFQPDGGVGVERSGEVGPDVAQREEAGSVDIRKSRSGGCGPVGVKRSGGGVGRGMGPVETLVRSGEAIPVQAAGKAR